MLYDPKWETKPSIEGFRHWLEQQPPTAPLDFYNHNGCPCANYARHHDMEDLAWTTDPTYAWLHSKIVHAIAPRGHWGILELTYGDLRRLMFGE